MRGKLIVITGVMALGLSACGAQGSDPVGEDQVESLSLYNKKTEEKQELSVNGVFIAVGILPNTEMYRGVVDLDEAGYVIAGEDGVTSCAGIFAAGDLRTKQLRQVITAAADGANVVTSIEKYLNEL